MPNSAAGISALAKTTHFCLKSYQQAFLFNMIVDKGDGRGDNTVYNPTTGQFVEVDNEYLAYTGRFYPDGILHDFTLLKKKIVTEDILTIVFSLQESQLAKIKDKYQARDAELMTLMSQEPCPYFIEDLAKFTSRTWEAIFDNLRLIQTAIILLKAQQAFSLRSRESQLTYSGYHKKSLRQN